MPYIERKYREAESDWSQQRYGEYLREIPCPVCDGQRLKPEVLAVLVAGHNISQIAELSLAAGVRVHERAAAHRARGEDRRAGAARDPAAARVPARGRAELPDHGARGRDRSPAARRSASGSRPRSARGSPACCTCSTSRRIGLHQRDNRRLIDTLVKLKGLGNTLIVVEHDEDTIRTADWIVDIGPGAGEHGGEIVHSGSYEALLENKRSITGDYIAGRRQIEMPKKRRHIDKDRQITVEGAKANNLQDVTVSFPLGAFVGVTGVSGSGKSSLVNDILYKVLANQLNGARQVPGQAPPGHRARAARQGRARRPGADRAHAALEPGDLHRGLRPHPHPVLATPWRRRRAATSPAGSASTSRAAAARTARATARSRSR